MNKINQIVGNELAISILQNKIRSGNIAPAYLFAGKSGVGKFKTALLFAQSLTSSLETLIIEPQQSDSTIPVIRLEQMHEIAGFCAIKPAINERRVIVIDAVSGLTEKCANALLKTLEEPPPQATIIIVSSHEVLSTIKSRCHQIRFNRLTDENVKQVLSSLEYDSPHDSVIHAARGSVSEALHIIEAWHQISKFVEDLSFSPTTICQALNHSNNISLLDIKTQLLLLRLLCAIWWKNTYDEHILRNCNVAFKRLERKVSPRSVWDNLLTSSLK